VIRAIAVVVVVVVAAIACARPAPPRSHLPAAGAVHQKNGSDDGTGILALASSRLMIDTGEPVVPPRSDAFGGWGYGGTAYGGSSYAGYTPHADTERTPRRPNYMIANLADAGSLTGTVTWPKPPQAQRRLKTPCGTIDNPTLRLGPNGEVGGAVVYLDRVQRGRPLEVLGQVVTLGGSMSRLGCTMSPSTQVMLPVPDALTLFNGARRDRYVVRPPTGGPTTVELGAGDFRTVAIDRGATAIGDADGRVIPGWIVTPGHPYVTMTDDRGRFRIDNIAPGVYDVVIWHPPVVSGYRGERAVYGAPVVVKRVEKIAPSTTRRMPPIALP
jgi:hypothetical protein